MTHDEFLTLKPGDLICHNASLYWYNIDSKGDINGDWDVDINQNFLLISFAACLPNIESTTAAARSCGGLCHDFQCTVLYEGRIFKIVLCPKNVNLISRA